VILNPASLIVPEGIEIHFQLFLKTFCQEVVLLIVPEGIEIFLDKLLQLLVIFILLIVPEGIEIYLN
jgi:hypothetical protein